MKILLVYSTFWCPVLIQGQLLRFLRMLRDKGKKLFLLTNSPFYFVDGGMRFMLQVTVMSEADNVDLSAPCTVARG